LAAPTSNCGKCSQRQISKIARRIKWRPLNERGALRKIKGETSVILLAANYLLSKVEHWSVIYAILRDHTFFQCSNFFSLSQSVSIRYLHFGTCVFCIFLALPIFPLLHGQSRSLASIGSCLLPVAQCHIENATTFKNKCMYKFASSMMLLELLVFFVAV
jgi:hypothetical protein